MLALQTTGRRFSFEQLATGGDGQRYELAAAYDLPAGGELSVRGFYDQKIFPLRSLQKAVRTIETDRTAIGMWERFGASSPKSWARNRHEQIGSTIIRDDQLADPPIGWLVDADLEQWVCRLHASGYRWTTIRKAVTHLRVILRKADRGLSLMRIPLFPELKGSASQNWIPTADDVAGMWAAAELMGPGHPVHGTQGEAHARAVLAFTGILGLRPQDVSGITWADNLQTDAGGRWWLVWVPEKTKWTRGDPMSIPVPPIVLHYLDCWRARSVSPLVFQSAGSVLDMWHKLADAAGQTELTEPKQDGSRELRFSLKRLRKFANVRANAVRSPAGNWLLGHGVDRNDRTNFLHYSECFRAPEYVSTVLESDVIAEPFGGFD